LQEFLAQHPGTMIVSATGSTTSALLIIRGSHTVGIFDE
jgi:hypothetical protein